MLVEASLSTAYRSVQHVWTTLASAFRTLFYALFKSLPVRDLPTVLAVADLHIGSLPVRDVSTFMEVANG